MIRRPPRSAHLPDTTLYRSERAARRQPRAERPMGHFFVRRTGPAHIHHLFPAKPEGIALLFAVEAHGQDRKSTRLNSSHANLWSAVFSLIKTRATALSSPLI